MSEPASTLFRLQPCPSCERDGHLLGADDVPFRARFLEPMPSDRDAAEATIHEIHAQVA